MRINRRGSEDEQRSFEISTKRMIVWRLPFTSISWNKIPISIRCNGHLIINTILNYIEQGLLFSSKNNACSIFWFLLRFPFSLFNKIRKRKRTKTTITRKVDVITSVELEIKNHRLFPLTPINADQTKRLAIAIESRHRFNYFTIPEKALY